MANECPADEGGAAIDDHVQFFSIKTKLFVVCLVI